MADYLWVSDEQLTAALADKGIYFVLGKSSDHVTLPMEPESLIAGLAKSQDARLRLALIPLFLNRPELSEYTWLVSKKIGKDGLITLQCYYQAALWLQALYHDQINVLIGEQPTLPDLFSSMLMGEVSAEPEQNLRVLARRHQQLTRNSVNWLGTYHHAVEVWLRGLELQRG